MHLIPTVIQNGILLVGLGELLCAILLERNANSFVFCLGHLKSLANFLEACSYLQPVPYDFTSLFSSSLILLDLPVSHTISTLLEFEVDS